MPRFFTYLIVMTALLMTACTKDEVAADESTLYGTWVKGANYGDTLYFSRKNDKNILKYNQSHNPTFLAPIETEYYFQNSVLSFALLGPSSPVKAANSFRWVQTGKVFDVYESEIFPFAATVAMRVTYTKVN